MKTIRINKSGFSWGVCCKENCIVTEIYQRVSDGKTIRLKYCINTGCGYKEATEVPVDPAERTEICS